MTKKEFEYILNKHVITTKEQLMQERQAVFSFEKLDGCIDGGSLLRVINKETGEESLQNISYIANNYIDYLVYSYNHETNGYEYTNILNSLISPPSKKWVEIEFENGFTIKCTEDHEFFTTEGYISANKLLDKHLFNSGCSNM